MMPTREDCIAAAKAAAHEAVASDAALEDRMRTPMRVLSSLEGDGKLDRTKSLDLVFTRFRRYIDAAGKKLPFGESWWRAELYGIAVEERTLAKALESLRERLTAFVRAS